ncbi:MAG: hypothetical protein AAB289_14660, partial [Chloroflexota bacterium]
HSLLHVLGGRMTTEEKRKRRNEQHRRYNRSEKGKRRYKRYEVKHPERAENWSSGMIAKGYRK